MAMRHVPPVDYDELVDDYEAGSTIQELAARTGWAQRTVWALLEERGVVPPSSGQRDRAAEAREARELLRRERKARLERERQQRKAEVEQLERANDLARRLRQEREARQQREADERQREEQARHKYDAIYLAEVEFERRAQGQLIKWLREYGDILTDSS